MRAKDFSPFRFLLPALLCSFGAFGSTTQATSDPIRYALCDLRVVYLYDNPAAIDWPTIYYLNDQYGCRVDLVTLTNGLGFQAERRSIEGRQLAAWRFTVAAGDSNSIDSVIARLWPDRRPDILMIGPIDTAGVTAQFARSATSLEYMTSSLFNIVRVVRQADAKDQHAVTLNAQESYANYRGRIDVETPRLMGDPYQSHPPEQVLSRYTVESRKTGLRPDLISGLQPLRLVRVLDSLLKDGAVRQALERKAGNYVSLLQVAQVQSDRPRLQSVVTAWQELTAFREAARVEPSLAAVTDYGKYLEALIGRVQQLAVAETGVTWDGEIVVRDSPYGPKVKFISTIIAAGPGEVKIAAVTFLPYWDSTAIVLDSVRQTILPHQSFVREYLIDINRQWLESPKAESLKFAVEMEAGGIPLVMTSSVPVRRTLKLAVRFEPGFYFVQPFAALIVDKVVSSSALRAVISKPLDFAGSVKINLETPTGIFAGAYRQDVPLEKGQATETIRIPFTVSKLFELGVHDMVVSLSVDNRVVAGDTGIIRIAGCHVEDTVAIGLLPDTTGHLEDILRMTDARWQTMSDRTLEVGDLSAYDVLLVGSGALRNYPSFLKIRGRLEDFVRGGGSLVILGQPQSWPSAALPVSLAPVAVSVSPSTLQIANAAHDLLKRPNPILTSGLAAYFERPTRLAGAVVSPAQPILTGPGSEMLLSVTNIGNGKVVYCGLPLVDMIGKLNIEAIHLLANILNY